MCEGDEWKNGDKPIADGRTMFGHYKTQARLLLDISGFDQIIETKVLEVSPDGDYVQLYSGGFMARGIWVRTSDCQVLSVLPSPNMISNERRETIRQMLKEDWDNNDNTNDIG